MAKLRLATLILVYVPLLLVTLYYLDFLPSIISRAEYKPLKIYVYNLHSKFNEDLVRNYGNYKAKSLLVETGLGFPLGDSEFLFETNQYALDIYFHYRLLHSNYLTDNITEADLYFIPWYANLAKEAGQYNAIWDFWKHMAHYYNLTFIRANIHKHFMIYGGCQQFAWAFDSLPHVANMSVVMLERTAKKSDRNFTRIIVAPYPAQIHFYPEHSSTIDFSKKILLASSIWNSRSDIRRTLAGACKNRKDVCRHLELKPNSDQYDHIYVFNLMSKSIFCLNPPGDSATRKSFYDALLVGCINVIYQNDIKYPFDGIFDYGNLTVYIPQKKAGQTIEILQAIPKEEIKQRQKYINENRIHFQYTVNEGFDEAKDLPFDKKDAFNLLLDKVYEQSLE